MTGEMSREDVTPEAYPIHFAVAKALKGEVCPFDVYQGPYVQVTGGRLWLCLVDDNYCTGYIFNEVNRKESTPFHISDTHLIATGKRAVTAAREVLS